MLHIIEHTLIDTVKLVPFLFLTYLVLELLEHVTGEKNALAVKKAGKWGPLFGGILGAAPQCGFSAAASNLYAGRVITLGTLMAIYLSTSDEMLPILISECVEVSVIVKILLLKMGIGIAAGFCIDLFFRRRASKRKADTQNVTAPNGNGEKCEKGCCTHLESGSHKENVPLEVCMHAIRHTLEITFFILIITFALNVVLHYVGGDTFAAILSDRPLLGPVISGLVGLIPNCAASVVITQLYLKGAMSLGTMMAGLLAGAGTGVLVLCRLNHNRKENMKIIVLLYLIGVSAGMILELLGVRIM